MPFISEILRHRSLSIVGLEKNTGKTVCLNYVLQRLADMNVPAAVTSIGVDGEQTDSIYATAKPEVTLYEKMRFITSEKHYLQRQLISKILFVDNYRTALGKLITAEVLAPGKALLSGAATTEKLRRQIADFQKQNIPITIVDGALSRLSLASPTVTDAMILATGAAVSPNLQQLISKTRFVCRLIALPEVSDTIKSTLNNIESGLYSIDSDNIAHDLGIASVFLLNASSGDIFRYGTTLFAAGAVSDRLLKYLAARPEIKHTTLIVRDFAKLFISPESYVDFIRRGGQIQVLQQSHLAAICLNPTSPQGYLLDSQTACSALSEALQLPVYDIMKVGVE